MQGVYSAHGEEIVEDDLVVSDVDYGAVALHCSRRSTCVVSQAAY